MKNSDWIVEEWPQQTDIGMGTHRPTKGVSVTHIPSGLKAYCNEHRSQHKNKEECIQMILEELKYPPPLI